MPNEETTPIQPTETPQWYVLRDLKRSNARERSYQALSRKGFRVFTPLRWVIQRRQGQEIRRQVPYLNDLLFVHSTRSALDPEIASSPTLQYRYQRGSAPGTPMTIRETDMDYFVRAVLSTDHPRFYTPDELTPALLGKQVRIVGGKLNGYTGRLQSIRGSRIRHLLVELPSLLCVSVEVEKEFIEVIA